jgi:hypothetical protein
VVNSGPFEVVNALDFNQIEHLVELHKSPMCIVAALLSATAEKTSSLGLEYELLVSCFEFGESRKNKKIFWPSSIAVLDQQLRKKIRLNIRLWSLQRFTESVNKGERWCEYYHNIFGVDVQSIRYRGLINWSSRLLADGTTDYVDDAATK